MEQFTQQHCRNDVGICVAHPYKEHLSYPFGYLYYIFLIQVSSAINYPENLRNLHIQLYVHNNYGWGDNKGLINKRVLLPKLTWVFGRERKRTDVSFMSRELTDRKDIRTAGVCNCGPRGTLQVVEELREPQIVPFCASFP